MLPESQRETRPGMAFFTALDLIKESDGSFHSAPTFFGTPPCPTIRTSCEKTKNEGVRKKQLLPRLSWGYISSKSGDYMLVTKIVYKARLAFFVVVLFWIGCADKNSHDKENDTPNTTSHPRKISQKAGGVNSLKKGASTRGSQGGPCQKVNTSSQTIRELLANISEDNEPEWTKIYEDIGKEARNRGADLATCVKTDNSAVQSLNRDLAKMDIRLVGHVQKVFGHPVSLWDLKSLDPRVFELAKVLSTSGPNIKARTLVGGSTVQDRVVPYAGDVDFDEEIIVDAADRVSAGTAIAAALVSSIDAAIRDGRVEFEKLMIGRTDERAQLWSEYEVRKGYKVIGPKKINIEDVLLDPNTSFLNTSWRGYGANGKLGPVGKVLLVKLSSGDVEVQGIPDEDEQPVEKTSKTFPKPRRKGNEIYFQAFYLLQPKAPVKIPKADLGMFLHSIYVNAHQWYTKGTANIKALKRAYTFVRALGDLSCKSFIGRLFSKYRLTLAVDYIAGRVEFSAELLDPTTPQTVVCRAHNLVDELYNLATQLDGDKFSRQADLLRYSARHVTAGSGGLLLKDETLAAGLMDVATALRKVANDRMKKPVKRVFTKCLYL